MPRASAVEQLKVTIADFLYECEEFDNRLMVNILNHLVKLKFDDIR